MTKRSNVMELHQIVGEIVIFAYIPPDSTDSQFLQFPRDEWLQLGQPVKVTTSISAGDLLNVVPDDVSALLEPEVFIQPTVEEVSFSECATREEAIALALGTAAGCWPDLSGAGKFDSGRAAMTYNALLTRLNELDEGNTIAPTGTPIEVTDAVGPHNYQDYYCKLRLSGQVANALAKCDACARESDYGQGDRA